MALTNYQNTPIQGRRVGTEQSGLIPTQVPGILDLLNDNRSAFGLYSQKLRKRPPVGDYTFIYHEDELPRTWTTAASEVAAAGTDLTVASGDGELLTPWAILWIPATGERIQVQEYAANDVITIKRAIDGGASAAIIPSGAEIQILPEGFEEGTGVPNMVSTHPNSYTNYIQKIITPVILTDDAQFSDNYYTKDETRQWHKAGLIHLEKEDRAMMLNGAPALNTSDTTNLTVANGAYPAAKGNKFGLTMGWWYWHETYADADHALTDPNLTEPDFVTKCMERSFDVERGKGSDHKICLHAQALTTGVMLWNLSRTRFWNSESKMKGSKESPAPGLRFSRYESPDGIIDFMRYPSFEAKVAGGYNRLAIIDTKRIGYTSYKKRRRVIKRDVIKNGDQIIAGYYQSMIGSIYQHPNVHVSCKFLTVS